MKANELQIGDYVNYRGQNIKVTSLYDKGGSNEVGWSDKENVWVNADNVEPIPLTPEILEKNGFEKQGFDGWLLDSKDLSWLILWRTDFSSPHLRIDSYSSKRGSFSSAVSYVHTLQHALHLCGIEKEIEL